MKPLLLLPMVLLLGCVSQSGLDEDLFIRQAEFAADRHRETTLLRDVPDLDAESVYVHVAEVLLDLNCTLKESNVALGVLSATPPVRPATNGWLPSVWRGCAGHRVTVTVTERGSYVQIRAAFDPMDEAADQAFTTLLRSSLKRKLASEGGHDL